MGQAIASRFGMKELTLKFMAFRLAGRKGLAVESRAGEFLGLTEVDASFPGHLEQLLESGAVDRAAGILAEKGFVLSEGSYEYLPPLSKPGKIICVGLNYRDHASESGHDVPTVPTVFSRFPSTLVGNGAPIVRPLVSDQLDYEGELVAVIGKPGRNIEKAAAMSHVAGYSLFNDASIRDFQMRTSQWTIGKNFPDTGAFGPYFVPAADLPSGCAGLTLTTRLNGQVVQSASIDDMVFNIATLIADLSIAFALEAGDIIVSGTPSGVGMARTPPLFMKAGDITEIEVQGLGVLRNVVTDQSSPKA